MDVKKCQKCSKGMLIKVPIPLSLIKPEVDRTKTKIGYRCNVCGVWSFE